jgi:hypothetical protein
LDLTQVGKKKVTPSIDSPHKYDHIMFIWRNRPGYNGTGNTYPSPLSTLLLGYKSDSYTNIGSYNKIPTTIARHEFSHQLFGGNNFHCAGGGWGAANYWIPLTGGWSALGLSGSSLLCFNAWDRQRLDWKPVGNTYTLSARDEDNSKEVNGDLDAANPSDAGIYTLRDFIISGDVIRIKLPFIDPNNEFPEYLWLENHTGTQNNSSPFDQWHYQPSECVDDFIPGLMAYLQIDKDTRLSDDPLEVFSGYSDYLRPLTADGFYDRDHESNSIFNDCVQWGDTWAFIQGLPNSLTGGSEQDLYTVDIDNDNVIKRDDMRSNFVEMSNNEYHKHLYALGHNDHIFTLNGSNKICIATNPSSASMMNLVSYQSPANEEDNLRKIYLNGISAEIIGIDASKNIQLRIRFDDVNIDRDVRWCADEIVLNPVDTESGFSLNIKAGRTMTLDQSLTATRMNDPIVFNGKNVFANPTTFVVKPNVKINLEPEAKVQLENASTFHLNSSSYCIIGNDGVLEIKNGTSLYLDDCSVLEIKGEGKLIVRSGATLCISPNAVLAFENRLQNLVLESGVIIPNGYADPASIINNTLSNGSINTNITWTSKNYIVNGSLTIESQSTLTIRTSTLSFIDENSKIIVKPGAKLILDGAKLTSACSKQWQGIQVWGNKNNSQYPNDGNYYQGFLELKNGSVIENSICAVELWKPGDWSSTGGIVYANGGNTEETKVVFRNNTKSVHALYYRNFNPYFPAIEWDYSSNFKNCIFEITKDYLGDERFCKHVDLAHVNGIDFEACEFSLAENVDSVSIFNSAIAGYGAKFGVKAICNSQQYPCPEDDYHRSTFTGFFSAINSVNDGSSPVTFNISRADFIDNAYGVKIREMNNASILFSDFQIGYLWYCGAGIYSDDVTGFAFEGNSFSKYVSGPPGNYFGIVINSSREVNEVYRNIFDGLSYANFADGKNWVGDDRFQGLSYSCNQNTNNYADFYINKSRPSGIQSFQGNSSSPAGNTFTQINSTWHFYNGGEHLVQYFCDQNASYENPAYPDKTYNIAITPLDDENGCPSHYGNDIRLVLTTAQVMDAEQDYYNNISDYNSIKSLYDSYIDGGDTEAEKLSIETAQPEDIWDLRSRLLGDSPHLSLEVLIEAADKTDVFSETALFDILSANPDELKKDTLINYLENKEEPLPDYMIELLEHIAKGSTYKTAMQKQMSEYKHNYTRAALDIVRSILNDTIMNDTLLRSWLDNLGGIEYDQQIIASFVSAGNFSAAFSLANMLPQLYDYSSEEWVEHNYYIDLLTLYHTLYKQGRNTYQLDNAEKALVDAIAAKSNAIAGSCAKGILEAVYNEYFPDCPDIASTVSYKQGSLINSETLGMIYGLEIEAMPNPASLWVEFDYILPENEKSGIITITNINGVVVKTLNVSRQQGRKLVDTRMFPSGVYFFTLNSGSYTKSGKIIIQN